MEEQRPTVSRRTKIIVLVIFVLYSAGFLGVMALKESMHVRPTAQDSLGTLTLVLGFLSIYGLALPWFIQNGRIINLRKPAARPGLLADPEVRVLMFGYVLLISPSLYGGMLYNLGLPALQAAAFVVASILTGIAWGIYNMRAG